MNNHILSIVLSLTVSLILPSTFQSVENNASRQPVIPISFLEMPVLIDSASLESISDNISELTYKLLNKSGEEITRVNLRAFVVNAKGKILHSEAGVNREVIKKKNQSASSMQVSRQLKAGEQVYLCVEGALAKSGTWYVDREKLKSLTEISSTSDLELKASFVPHLQFTARDRSEILSLVLTDIANDAKKRALIGETLILRTDELNVNPSDLAGNKFLFLSSNQIRDMAQSNGSLKYLYIESLKAEGSSVEVRIVLRDQPSQYPAMRVPLSHTFVFSCICDTGKWNVEWASSVLSGG